MSHTEPASEETLTALAPDPSTLSSRGLRAWTERMALERLSDRRRYAVTSESGECYTVDPSAGRCDCPDHSIRGETCKHLRRVALEITAGRLLPPGATVTCAACERAVDAAEVLCGDCALESGEIVRDRETGERLVVARVLSDRADDVMIPTTTTTVADYPTNAGYPPDDIVVEGIYVADMLRRDDPRRYRFPHARLEPIDDAAVIE